MTRDQWTILNKNTFFFFFTKREKKKAEQVLSGGRVGSRGMRIYGSNTVYTCM
jgi:hypothetical protein